MDHTKWGTWIYKNDQLEKEERFLVPEQAYTLIINETKIDEILCSPWYLEDLVYGRLYMMGLINKKDEVDDLLIDSEQRKIYVKMNNLRKQIDLNTFFENIKLQNQIKLSPEKVNTFAQLLDEASAKFRKTGGVHSAAIASTEKILMIREDVGRHNVMDKLMGACLEKDIVDQEKILVFSGRIATQILQKAVILGCSMIIAISAPTDSACRLAEEKGLALIGFARNQSFNIYTGKERIDLSLS